jgi:monoterpene epsilon-lactone hydrolase
MFRLFRLFVLAFVKTAWSRWSGGPLRPTWPFSFEVTVRFLRKDWDSTSEWELPRVRAELDARPYPSTIVRKVVTRDGDLGGVPARWFTPPNAGEGAAVLYFHGGSYVLGSARTTHADVIARLALASGVTLVGVDYRLAPEHAYPAQSEDAWHAFEALRACSGMRRVIVAGDSAGGNLAIELQIALRDRGLEQAAGAVLISPWSDLTMPGTSFRENDRFDYGTREVLARQARVFAGTLALDDPRLSPVNAKLASLAPVFILAGEAEIPRDDILTLADRLERANVEVTRHLATDMPHNAPVFAAYHPSAQLAVAAIARFIRQRAM